MTRGMEMTFELNNNNNDDDNNVDLAIQQAGYKRQGPRRGPQVVKEYKSQLPLANYTRV